MQSDLKNYFELSAVWKKKLTRSLIIRKLNNGSSNSLIADSLLPDKKSISINSASIAISDLAIALDQIVSIPVIDEASLTSQIIVKLPKVVNSLNQLKKIFNQQGLDLAEEEMEMEMFVISKVMD